jgi:hypothetical protein
VRRGRSWIAQSACRTGAGPHADTRERRSCSTRRQCRDRAVAEQLDTADVGAEVQAAADAAEEILSTHPLTLV